MIDWKNVSAILAFGAVLAGCNPFTSTLDKQTAACVKDVQMGLGDPNSLEVLSVDEIPIDGGEFRIHLHFTAKNAMGGRIRGSARCGFASKDSSELNPEDLFNRERKMLNILKSPGTK